KIRSSFFAFLYPAYREHALRIAVIGRANVGNPEGISLYSICCSPRLGWLSKPLPKRSTSTPSLQNASLVARAGTICPPEPPTAKAILLIFFIAHP
ncbi:hypothetical protein CPC197_1053B, partial [Chlamydia psittaci C1/97]